MNEFFYYFPDMGESPQDARMTKQYDTEQAAKHAHELSNYKGDFTDSMVVMVSDDMVNWRKFETRVHIEHRYSAEEVRE